MMRYAFRRLTRVPGYVALFSVTLGLGLGVLGTALGAFQAATRTVPPIQSDGEIAFLRSIVDGRVLAQSGLNAAELQRSHTIPNDLLTLKSSYIFFMTALDLGGRSLPVKGEAISGSYFAVLGVRPLSGRLLDEGTESSGQFVVSERLWRTHLGADAAAVGKTFRVGGRAFVLVGIVPGHFNGLHGGHVVGNDVWLDRTDAQAMQTEPLSAFVFGRVGEGRTMQDVNDAIRASYGFAAVSVEDKFEQSPTALVATGFVVLLLAGVVVLACYSNVAGVLLTRLQEREPELRIRALLGASSKQLLALLLGEVVVLVVLSLAVAFAVAQVLTGALAGFEWSVGRGLNLRVVPVVDWRVLAAVAGGAAICAVSLSVAAHRALQSGRALERASRRQVVGVQCAVAVFLMMLTMPLLFELRGTQQRHSSERSSTLTTGWLDHNVLGTPSSDRGAATSRIVNELSIRPTLSRVSVASDVPTGRRGRNVRVTSADGPSCGVLLVAVSGGFLAMLDHDIVRGRMGDGVILNEAAATRCGAGTLDLGDRLAIVDGAQSTHVNLIGVVRTPAWLGDDQPRIFVPLELDQHLARVVVVVEPRPGAASAALSASDQLFDVRQLKDEVMEGTGPLMASASLGSLLSVTALSTSALGLFGLVSLQAARRRREFATRMALGARAIHIYRLVVSDYARTLAVSCVVGGVAALLVGRYLASNVAGLANNAGLSSLFVPLLVVAGVIVVAVAAVWRALRDVSYQTLKDA